MSNELTNFDKIWFIYQGDKFTSHETYESMHQTTANKSFQRALFSIICNDFQSPHSLTLFNHTAEHHKINLPISANFTFSTCHSHA